MKKSMILATVTLASVTSAALGSVGGVTAFGVSTNGRSLYSWDVSTPGFSSFLATITGMQTDEVIKGIDFRPATGELYGLGSRSNIYTINTATGAATQVGTSSFTPALSGSSFGFDFNPTVDRIRITSDAGQNLRVNPNSGAVAGNDINLNGATSSSVGSAYTNSYAGATSTTLYDIDSTTDALYIQNPPNNGVTTLVGSLGVDFNSLAGFDIHGPNAYAVLNTDDGAYSGFYQINLQTGAATFLGEIGDGQRGNVFFGSLAIVPTPGVAGVLGLAGLGGLRRRR